MRKISRRKNGKRTKRSGRGRSGRRLWDSSTSKLENVQANLGGVGSFSSTRRGALRSPRSLFGVSIVLYCGATREKRARTVAERSAKADSTDNCCHRCVIHVTRVAIRDKSDSLKSRSKPDQ